MASPASSATSPSSASPPESALRSSYTVAVRALCDFTAKQGDLDLRFTPSATALEGLAGQATVAARRGAAYRSELSLAGRFDERLLVRGRADGYDADRQRLEEVKTFRGDLARMPANRRALHWAQLKVYGALLCRQDSIAELTLALVYFDVATQTETVLAERHAAADLQAFFDDLCRRFLAWADQEIAHAAGRDAALAALPFPHAEFRTGQRPLAEAVYRAAIAGRPLLAQAPTGIGKTVGTLYPLLKSWRPQRLDKLFFLSAKTPGRAVALQALALIAAVPAGVTALPLRVLELVARDKACEHPDKACHGDSCPLASGFYDRLPAARAELVAAATTNAAMDRAGLRQVALAHRICPYYLGQEMVRWADVIVADYNHYFDSSALLYGMTVANDWRVGVLVDEAHNLVPRARAMYSAALGSAQLQAVRPFAPSSVDAALARLARCWADLRRQQLPEGATYATCEALPPPWTSALQAVITAFADHLAAAPADPSGLAPPLLRFYFDVLNMSRLCDSFGAHSLFDLTAEADDGEPATSGFTVSVRNLVPASFLAPRFAAARAAVLFSATLAPVRFHIDLLGLPADDTAWVDTPSPFASAQLQVHIASAISTRFDRREASLAPIVDLMARQYAHAPGNYLAFLSSFDYQGRVAALFRERHPDVPVWQQSRQMDEAARAAFLERFRVDGCGIGFAVLGGAFAEGIDLAGRRLIGAFIATLGLPQVNPVNEQMKARMDSLFTGRGHDYTYLFPGLQRVVQAAGRVIRTPQDTGTVHLIDDRFDRPEVRALLPSWWALPARSGSAGIGSQPASADVAQGLGPTAFESADDPNSG